MFLGLHFQSGFVSEGNCKISFCLDLLHHIARVSTALVCFLRELFHSVYFEAMGGNPGSISSTENCVLFPVIYSVIWNVKISQD